MMFFRGSRWLLKQSSSLVSKRRLSNAINLVHMSEAQRVETLRTLGMSQARPEPIIKQLNSPDFHVLFTDELQRLAAIFKQYGYEIRIAGGAVRDLLMGLAAKDLDFATTATPAQMKDMFTAEGVRMINTNGERHGTITARINDATNFEITSLRLDVLCDGRRAQVQFITDWLVDALRRDLTINSMFLDLDGNVYDHFFGYDDLKARKIRFVGNAVVRIREDYLRILRYFRFYGRIAVEPDAHDADTLTAICENCPGLANVSGERIWAELKKILEGNYTFDILRRIISCGLGPFIGLPTDLNFDELQRVSQLEARLQPITIVTSLLRTAEDVHALHKRLKLSAFERDLAFFIVDHRNFTTRPDKMLINYQQLVMQPWRKCTQDLVVDYIIEHLKYQNLSIVEEFSQWTVPNLPIAAKMLQRNGVPPGRKIGAVLRKLKLHWIEHEFKPDKDELLKLVPDIMRELSANQCDVQQ